MWNRWFPKETDIPNLWEMFKQVPEIFDDSFDGDYEKFKERTLDPKSWWYKFEKGFVVISEIKFEQKTGWWHTIMPQGIDLREAWDVMDDVFSRGIDQIWGAVPEFNVKAIKKTLKAGWEPVKTLKHVYPYKGVKYDLHLYVIDKERKQCHSSQQQL